MTSTTAKVELTLYRARAAARTGDLDEAALLLAALDSSSPAVLDLRARVHAQRGELDEADRCWAQVSTSEAAAGRAQIERIRSGRRRARPVVTTGRAAAATVLACTLAVGGLVWSLGEAPVAPPSAGAPDRARALEQRLAVMERERAAAEAGRSTALDAIAAAFTMPGVVVHRRDTDVQIIFNEGMFGGDSSAVAPSEVPLLREVGRRLATARATMTVVGHSVAVPGGQIGGAPIALDRAMAAAEHLASGGALPLTAFTLTTADQQANPHSDPTRNRTVTLLLTPAAG